MNQSLRKSDTCSKRLKIARIKEVAVDASMSKWSYSLFQVHGLCSRAKPIHFTPLLKYSLLSIHLAIVMRCTSPNYVPSPQFIAMNCRCMYWWHQYEDSRHLGHHPTAERISGSYTNSHSHYFFERCEGVIAYYTGIVPRTQ